MHLVLVRRSLRDLHRVERLLRQTRRIDHAAHAGDFRVVHAPVGGRVCPDDLRSADHRASVMADRGRLHERAQLVARPVLGQALNGEVLGTVEPEVSSCQVVAHGVSGRVEIVQADGLEVIRRDVEIPAQQVPVCSVSDVGVQHRRTAGVVAIPAWVEHR